MPVYGWVAFGILGTGLALLLLGGNDGDLFGVAPEQIAGLTAMLAILVYLGSGLFGRGQALGPLVRQALIWGTALIALALGYSFVQPFLG